MCLNLVVFPARQTAPGAFMTHLSACSHVCLWCVCFWGDGGGRWDTTRHLSLNKTTPQSPVHNTAPSILVSFITGFLSGFDDKITTTRQRTYRALLTNSHWHHKLLFVFMWRLETMRFFETVIVKWFDSPRAARICRTMAKIWNVNVTQINTCSFQTTQMESTSRSYFLSNLGFAFLSISLTRSQWFRLRMWWV